MRVAVSPPNDEAGNEPLLTSDVGVRSGRLERLLDPLFDPAGHAEVVIAGAYVAAVVGLVLPLVTGLHGSVAVLTVSTGLLFLSFLALFYCALVINDANGASGDRARR